MFKHLLVPLDGSKLAEATLPMAVYLAKILKTPVTLLHIIELDAPEEIHHDRHLTNSSEAEAYLARVAKDTFPDKIKVDYHIHTSAVADVAQSIVDHSVDEIQPGLILLCAHGNSGMHDLFYGNIAQQVVAASTSPVLLIKPGEPPDQLKIHHILLPLDNESLHDKAIPTAAYLAKKCKAQLHLLCVIPTLGTLAGEQAASGSLLPSTTTAFLDMAEEIALEHFQVHLDEFQNSGIASSAEIARGDPAAIIAKTADNITANLIIFGTHGRAGLDAFWNRSVAASVARRTQTPLLLIPLVD